MSLADRLFKFREFQAEPKPFLDHVEDLRSMIIKMVVVLGAAMMLSFCFRGHLSAIVQHPLVAGHAAGLDTLQSLGVVDSFSITLQLAFYAGIVISFPFLLFFLAEFVLPALTEAERKHLWPAAAMGFGLFLTGVFFAYFLVLPRALDFFYHDAMSLGWKPTWAVREYYAFTTQLVIAFGLAFELPVVILLLVKMGVLNVAQLKRIRPQAFVGVMVLAAVLAPTPDVVTMLLMGVPMYFLYELSIIVAIRLERRAFAGDAGR